MNSLALRSAIIVFVISCLTGGVAQADEFNVKPGRWLWTMTVSKMAWPDDVSPAQRAQAEHALTMMSEFPSCLTKEDLLNLRIGKPPGDEEDEDCKTSSQKSTATTFDFVQTCSGDWPHTVTVHGEATSPAAMRITMSSTAKQGPAEMSMVGKWSDAVCAEED